MTKKILSVQVEYKGMCFVSHKGKVTCKENLDITWLVASHSSEMALGV